MPSHNLTNPRIFLRSSEPYSHSSTQSSHDVSSSETNSTCDCACLRILVCLLMIFVAFPLYNFSNNRDLYCGAYFVVAVRTPPVSTKAIPRIHNIHFSWVIQCKAVRTLKLAPPSAGLFCMCFESRVYRWFRVRVVEVYGRVLGSWYNISHSSHMASSIGYRAHLKK